MTKYFLISILFLTLAGCSGDSSNQNTVDAGAVSGFADAAAALTESNRLLDANETQQAIDVLKQAVALDPDLAEAHFKLGIAYALIETENQDEGIEEELPISTSRKAREVETESEKAFEKAVEAYKKFLAKNPDDDAAHYNLGRAYNKLNEDEEAAISLREAVKLKPDDTEYQTELGAILIKLAKYPEAVVALRKAFELDPLNSRAEELLEDAQAGRSRTAFSMKNEKKAGNTNANSNANTAVITSNSTTSANSTKKEKPTPLKTANKP